MDYIPDPLLRQKAVSEMSRVARRSGYVVVTVPNRWYRHYNRTMQQAMREGRTDFGYEYRYSPPEIRRSLTSGGLIIEAFVSNVASVSPIWFPRVEFRLFQVLSWFGNRIGFRAKKP